MRLRTKLIVISLGFTLLTTLFIGSILRSVIEDTYTTVEMDVFEEKMIGYGNQVIEEYARIESILMDWSVWDLTYDYVINPNESYIDNNVSISFYKEQKIDYLVIVDDDNQVLYGKEYLKESHTLKDLEFKDRDLFNSYKNSKGLLSLEDHLVLYMSLPITNNEGDKPNKGQMIFAYKMGIDMKERLEKDNGFTSTINIVDNILTYNNVKSLDYGLMTSVDYRDDQGIGNIFFPIINTDHYLNLSINLGNDIHTLGNQHIQESMVYTILVLCLFSILMFISLGQFVIKRIVKLNIQVNEITHGTSDKKRVTVVGKDELGQLSHNINNMLNTLEDMHSEIEHHAYYDDMTGAFNRRKGFEVVESLMSRFDGSNGFSIVYLDINDLKETNDVYGHISGDQLILDTVSIINENLDQSHSVIRLGGDEFLIVLPELDNMKAFTLMKRVDESIEDFNQSQDRVYEVSISYGIAEYTDEMSVDLFIDQADNRMYHAKKLYRKLKRESN